MITDKTKPHRSMDFDLLRFISAVAVVVIHVCGIDWYALDVDSAQWFMATVWDALCRFSVPVFFMISGALLLDNAHESDMKTMLTKRIPKILIAFFFWSAVYTFMNIIRSDDIKADIESIIIEFFTGEYHMWFVLVLCALYIITPFLKVVANDEKLCKPFILLFVVFQLVFPFLSELPKAGDFVKVITDKFVFHFAMGYSGYYVLGYYLKKNLPKGKPKAFIYAASAVGLIYTVASVVYVSRLNSRPIETGLEYLTWNVALVAVGVFTAVLSFCEKKDFGKKSNMFIIKSASYSFGIYLIHPAVLAVLHWLGFSVVSLPVSSAISVPLIALSVTVISYVLTAILRNIPKIGKMIT